MSVLTTRTLRDEISELISSGWEAGMVACHHEQTYFIKLVPVIDGCWLHSEALLVFTRPGQPRTLRTAKSVLSFACRYGIDARRVRFMEGRA